MLKATSKFAAEYCIDSKRIPIYCVFDSLYLSSLKPSLTDANKVKRLEYCLNETDIENKTIKNKMDKIHIDEKWFYMSSESAKFYLVKGEDIPKWFANINLT